MALVGVSLGAYLAGLTGCGEARLASIVMAIPGTRMGLMLSQAEQVVGRRVREVILRRRAACVELGPDSVKPDLSPAGDLEGKYIIDRSDA